MAIGFTLFAPTPASLMNILKGTTKHNGLAIRSMFPSLTLNSWSTKKLSPTMVALNESPISNAKINPVPTSSRIFMMSLVLASTTFIEVKNPNR